MTAPDPYSKLSWVDGKNGGTPATVARGPIRWEEGIFTNRNAILDILDRLEALEAGGGGGAGLIPRGPTSGRGAPTAGKPYVDTDLDPDGVLIIGTGTGWAKADGTLLTGAGSSNAPTNVTATPNADNTILVKWDAYPGGTSSDSITIHTSDNPTGVATLAGNATQSLRGPFTRMGAYEYWITFTPVSTGVRTAESNHATTSLPVDGGVVVDPGGGGGGSVSPWFALKINGLNGGTGGNWNLGVAQRASTHKDRTFTELVNGWTDPLYCDYNPTTQAVRMRAWMNGGTTSGSGYPRVELRELMPDGTTKMTFKANNGTHVISGTTRVTHFAPNKKEVCIVQMHDAKDDRFQIRIENTNVVVKCNGRGDVVNVDTTVQTGLAIGTFLDWKVEMINGTFKFYTATSGSPLVLRVTHSSPSYSGDSTDDQYLKVGCYAQQSVNTPNPADEYCEIELKNLFTSHSTTS